MQTATLPFQSGVFKTGIVLILVSLAAFLVPVLAKGQFDTLGYFLVNFILTVLYFLILAFSGSLRRGRQGLFSVFLLLILFLISAYSLNREMVVFEQSQSWFVWLLVITCINYILFAFYQNLPKAALFTISFIAGLALVVFAYLSFYLLPMYLLSVLAAVFIGISLHTFVPLLFCIYTLVLYRRIISKNTKQMICFWSGTTFATLVIIVFTSFWVNYTSAVNKQYRYASVAENSSLPAWSAIAAQLPQNFVTEKLMKTGLVYSVVESTGGDWFWRMPSRNFNEVRKHDPLVVIATLFSGKITVPEEDKIKILESMYDSRHQAEERFWGGEDLITEKIETHVKLWQTLRLAYTEKKIMVSNLSSQSWSQQEAIYTMHLPEGSVVTSLSLWIEGKEERARLSTRAKAQNAYATIVGKESRDPSVVHWQEGNRVSIRVFPVLPGESRLFKIGITSPLQLRDNKLQYQNIYFDGPDMSKAEEDLSLEFDKQPLALNTSLDFDQPKPTLLQYRNRYKPGWQASFASSPIPVNTFNFDHYNYTIEEAVAESENFNASAYYLDLNSSWSRKQYEGVLRLLKGSEVYAFEGDAPVLITEYNKQQVYEKLRDDNFSIFPFYRLKADNALVITSSGPASPSLQDLKESGFHRQMQDYFNSSRKIYVFDIGTGLSPYLKTLRECRTFYYQDGNIDALSKVITNKVFRLVAENNEQVYVEAAGIVIKKRPGETVSSAPDHLMRLYAYNNIMRKYGTGLYTGNVKEDEMIAEAQQAYIVTPASSLVVLETQKDYERFDIDKSKNSLENASLKSTGSVPEPHEWALIIMVLILLAFGYYKPTFLFTGK